MFNISELQHEDSHFSVLFHTFQARALVCSDPQFTFPFPPFFLPILISSSWQIWPHCINMLCPEPFPQINYSAGRLVHRLSTSFKCKNKNQILRARNSSQNHNSPKSVVFHIWNFSTNIQLSNSHFNYCPFDSDWIVHEEKTWMLKRLFNKICAFYLRTVTTNCRCKSWHSHSHSIWCRSRGFDPLEVSKDHNLAPGNLTKGQHFLKWGTFPLKVSKTQPSSYSEWPLRFHSWWNRSHFQLWFPSTNKRIHFSVLYLLYFHQYSVTDSWTPTQCR